MLKKCLKCYFLHFLKLFFNLKKLIMIDVKNLLYTVLLLLPSKNKVEDEATIDTLLPIETNKVKEIKKDTISLWRTSYKVLETKFNPTRYVSWKNKKINDMYNVPNFIALQRETADKLGLELGDKITFIMPNGEKIIKIFADYMSSKGVFKIKNSNRVDFMINADEKFVSHEVKLVLP